MIPFHEGTSAHVAPGGTDLRESAQARDLDLYLSRLFLPIGDNLFALADWSAENLAWLRAAHGEAGFVAVAKSELLAEAARRFDTRLTDDAILGLAREFPDLSARRVVTRGQAAALILLAAWSVAFLCWRPGDALDLFVFATTVLFAVFVLFRAFLAWYGGHPGESAATPASDDANLPLYSILVPLYRETAVLPVLAQSLLALDYPGMLAQRVKPESRPAGTLAQCRGSAPTWNMHR